jgi:hypothetical protein
VTDTSLTTTTTTVCIVTQVTFEGKYEVDETSWEISREGSGGQREVMCGRNFAGIGGWADYREHIEPCCLPAGSYTLSCKATGGYGWQGGYMIIDKNKGEFPQERFCDDFKWERDVSKNLALQEEQFEVRDLCDDHAPEGDMWVDPFGRGCSWYEGVTDWSYEGGPGISYCDLPEGGKPGSGGMTARSACCACGGGSKP